MRKLTLAGLVVLVLAVAFSTNAFAADDVTAWQGFWNSVGGFFHNALPWNWGSWMGK